MPTRNAGPVTREVSPLELFFDLVFVLAISQLTHHLVAHLTWHGAAETLIMLVAVCGVWSIASFQATLLDIERTATRALLIGVMGLALFMNAGIVHAFDHGPWLFVAPVLVAVVGLCVYAAVTAPTAPLRGHFGRLLVWVGASAPLWVAGALSTRRCGSGSGGRRRPSTSPAASRPIPCPAASCTPNASPSTPSTCSSVCGCS
jgi:low temperature requirement protein LtrA